MIVITISISANENAPEAWRELGAYLKTVIRAGAIEFLLQTVYRFEVDHFEPKMETVVLKTL